MSSAYQQASRTVSILGESITALLDERDQLTHEHGEAMALLREAAKWLAMSALRCDQMHHDTTDRHGYDQPCPVGRRLDDMQQRINALLARREG